MKQVITFDASGKILGRLATEIAVALRGKNKPGFVLNKNLGDSVVVINAAKIAVTGDKLNQKKYYKHSGYQGSLREETLKQKLKTKPEEVIRIAVRGMLPSNKITNEWMKSLTVYAGEKND